MRYCYYSSRENTWGNYVRNRVCVYKYVYLYTLMIIKQHPGSYANKIEDKSLFKPFNVWKDVNCPVKHEKIISA